MKVIGNMLGIYFSPEKTFKDIDAKKDWIAPLIVVLSVTLLVSIIIMKPIIIPELIQRVEAMDYLDTDMKETILSKMDVQQLFVRNVVSSVVKRIFNITMSGLILLLVISTVTKHASYRKVITAVVYSSLVIIPESLIKVPLMFIKETSRVYTSLGLFMPVSMEKTYISHVLNNFDIFTLWSIIIVTIGIRVLCVAEKAKVNKIVVSLWMCWVLLSSLLPYLLKI